RHPLLAPAAGAIPQAHAAIIATAGQPRAVRTPGHATDLGRLRAPDPAAGARCRIPHLHSPHITPTSQEAPVGTPGHTLEDGVDSVRVPKPLQTGTRSRVPQPDG